MFLRSSKDIPSLVQDSDFEGVLEAEKERYLEGFSFAPSCHRSVRKQRRQCTDEKSQRETSLRCQLVLRQFVMDPGKIFKIILCQRP